MRNASLRYDEHVIRQSFFVFLTLLLPVYFFEKLFFVLFLVPFAIFAQHTTHTHIAVIVFFERLLTINKFL